MRPKNIVRLVVNLLWLFVGGILVFWISDSQLPWIIVGVLISIIAGLGLIQSIHDAMKKR
jgi:hypothetical protein